MKVCIYHSKDLDGFCSGAIVKRKFPDVKLIGYDYGQPFPWDQIAFDDEVFMVDVSLKMPEMAKLAASCFRLFWVDHHITQIEEYESSFTKEQKKALHGILIPHLQSGVAACELTWEYLFPDEPMPISVELLGKYDTWRGYGSEEWNEEILPFQYGMRSVCISPETFPNEMFRGDKDGMVGSVLYAGKIVLSYQEKQNERAMSAAFTASLEGVPVLACNIGGANSIAFKSAYDPTKHDMVMAFVWNGKYGHWKVSLYSEKPEIDCGALATSLGGGGHRSAAGFEVKGFGNLSKYLISI